MNSHQTLLDSLGMEIVDNDKECVTVTMPVDHRTHQPAGFLHGGANVALAETAASVGALLHVDGNRFNVFGIEINANHIKSKRDGTVTAKAIPKHIGKTTMVWEIQIVDEQEQLICLSRCTIGVVPKQKRRRNKIVNKSNLSEEKVTYFKNKLQSLRQEIVNDDAKQEDSAPNDDIQELADYDNHPADMGTEQFEQERTKGFEQMRKGRLQEIDDALARIENGTYGVSQLSGKPIPEERLEAEPTAKYLVEEDK